MRIAIDCRKAFDFGIGTYVRGLVAGLAELDAEADYVLIAPERARDLLPAQFEIIPLETPNYSVAELVDVARVIERERVDLFHAPHFVLPWTASCPMVATLHDVIFFNHPSSANPVALAYVAMMTARAARKSARVVTVSEASRRELVARFDLEPDKVRVTPNGIDARFFAESDHAAPGERPYFLFVGNDKPHKNLGRLVEAFSAVRTVRPELTLRLAGGQFDRFGGVAGVVRAGFVPDEAMPSLYRGAIALVMPSEEEGFGLPAAEAMASGTAVITSTAPALVEVTGDAALHVNARSAAELAEAMLRVAMDARLRARLVETGRVRARAFTWRRCAEETLAVYREVISERPARG